MGYTKHQRKRTVDGYEDLVVRLCSQLDAPPREQGGVSGPDGFRAVMSVSGLMKKAKVEAAMKSMFWRFIETAVEARAAIHDAASDADAALPTAPA